MGFFGNPQSPSPETPSKKSSISELGFGIFVAENPQLKPPIPRIGNFLSPGFFGDRDFVWDEIQQKATSDNYCYFFLKKRWQSLEIRVRVINHLGPLKLSPELRNFNTYFQEVFFCSLLLIGYLANSSIGGLKFL